MTILGAAIEIGLLTFSLSVITGICKLARVATDATIIAIVLFGFCYALTVVTRGDMNQKDKNVYRQ